MSDTPVGAPIPTLKRVETRWLKLSASRIGEAEFRDGVLLSLDIVNQVGRFPLPVRSDGRAVSDHLRDMIEFLSQVRTVVLEYERDSRIG